jgi:hypothetical protein
MKKCSDTRLCLQYMRLSTIETRLQLRFMANGVFPSAGYYKIKATRGIRRDTVALMRDLTDRSIDKPSSFPAIALTC